MPPYYLATGTSCTATIWSNWTMSNTWGVWTTPSNSTTLTTQIVWPTWVASTSTYTYIHTDYLWSNWTNATVTPVALPTLEQRAASERRLAEERERIRIFQAEREQSEARARELLEDHLTREQKDTLTRLGYFDLLVRQRRYRIKKGWAGNVRVIDGQGRETRSYCIHPRDFVPNGDNMLAQKLLLENDESEFLRIANESILIPGVAA